MTLLCVRCGAVNRSGARYCRRCSQPLVGTACVRCGQKVRSGAAFCSRCGLRLGTPGLSPAAARCPDCGCANRPDATFCQNCGAALRPTGGLICPHCGADNRAQARYCHQCRRLLVPSTPDLRDEEEAGGATCCHCGAANREGARFCQQCGQLVREPAERAQRYKTGRFPPNEVLRGAAGEYTVLELIARGGMGAVYRVRRNGDETIWALKEMSETAVHPDDLQATIAAFEQEAQLLMKLEHRNLPRVVDHFESNSRQYLVMDFIEGQTMEELLAGGHKPAVEEVLAWADELCVVLDYLHAQQPPIVYRDLKPGNIMLEREGRLKLIDFGIARRFKGGKSRDTLILGTPGYAPPEQYGTGEGESDPRSDVYALGALLHQLLTGVDPMLIPFHFDPVRQHNPQVSLAAAEAIRRAVAHQIEDRPPSVAAFYAALQDRTFSSEGPAETRGAEGGQAAPDQAGERSPSVKREAVDRPVAPRAAKEGTALLPPQPLQLGAVRRGKEASTTFAVQVLHGPVNVEAAVPWLQVTPGVADLQTAEIRVSARTNRLALARQTWPARWRGGLWGCLLRLLLGWGALHARLLVPAAREHRGAIRVNGEEVEVVVQVEPAGWQRALAWLLVLLLLAAELLVLAFFVASYVGW